jgi:Transposase DDE domain group 1
LHGHQEAVVFHGYFDCYCYLPLYVFCGRHLLAAKLRPSNIDGFSESLDPDKLERLGRYKVRLDRNLERTLAMLLRLKDLRQGAIAG